MLHYYYKQKHTNELSEVKHNGKDRTGINGYY